MESVCSESRVSGLLHEIADVRSEMSWAKVESWSKAMVASLKKMRREYGGFEDVIVPFSAAFTQVWGVRMCVRACVRGVCAA